jgi:hypothetical protein
MARRRKLTAREKTELVFHTYDLDLIAWTGRELRDEPDRLYIADISKRTTLDSFVDQIAHRTIPTFLIIKLAAVSEKCLDKLWALRFPEIPKRKFSYDEKLKTLAEHHSISTKAFKDLWNARNRMAHEPSYLGTWAEYDAFEQAVVDFIESIPEDERTTRKQR